MKPILLACLLVATSVLAPEEPSVAAPKFCFQVNGLGDGVHCGGRLDDSGSSPAEDRMRDSIWLYAFEVANSCFLAMPAPELEMRREMGRKLMSVAPDIVFPELGNPITKQTPAVAYCSSTVGKGLAHPFDADVSAMGKGRCAEVMVVYVKGLSEGC